MLVGDWKMRVYSIHICHWQYLPAVFVQGAEAATVCSDMVWKEKWPVNRFNCFAKLRICQDAAYKMPLPFWTAIANWLPKGAAWKLHEVAFSNANVWRGSFLEFSWSIVGNGFLDQTEFYRFLVTCDCRARTLTTEDGWDCVYVLSLTRGAWWWQ